MTATAEKKCCLSDIFKPAAARSETGPLAPAAVPSFAVEAGPFSLRFGARIDELGADWDFGGAASNLLLDRRYLRVLEQAPPAGIDFGYLLYYREGRPMGKAILQYIDFDAATHLKAQREVDDREGMEARVKRALARRLKYRVLVCGNLLFTGEHAYSFDQRFIKEPEALTLLRKSLDWLAARDPVDAVLIKDILASQGRRVPAQFEASDYHRIAFQPNMVLDLRSEWRSLSDYLDSMTSKYRVRARRAFKKGKTLVRRDLSATEVAGLESQLFRLYRAVADEADFNLFHLHRRYFSYLKAQLPEHCRIRAYFQEEQLVGFYSTLQNGAVREAHFLGFDPQVNRDVQLYLNMLYDIIGEGLEAGDSAIVFARTAMEIKSSVGARAVDMDLLLRANNSWFNKLLPTLIHLLEPKVNWTPRHPFK